MQDRRTLTGLKVFLLYCALLALAGPAVFWAARLGMHVPPSRVQGFVGYFWDADGTRLSHVAIPLEGERDLFLDGAWSRWRLAWASPQLLLFMFADGAGKYRSMTRSVLETLIAIGALRLVSGQTIMAGALDAVAEAALLNSMESVP